MRLLHPASSGWFPNFVLLLAALCLPSALSAQKSVGQWTAYLSHLRGVDIAMHQGHVGMASERGLAWYDSNRDEYQEYSKVEGLSDAQPTAITVDTASGTWFLAHATGVIDYFTSPGSFKALVEIRNSRQLSDRRINQLLVHQGHLYVAAQFGIVVYDLLKFEAGASYTKIGPNGQYKAVYGMAMHGGRIWASTDSGLYSGSLASTANLADSRQWRRESGNNGLPELKFMPIGGDLRMLAWNDTLMYELSAGTWQQLPIKNYGNPAVYGTSLYHTQGGDVYRQQQGSSTLLFNAPAPRRLAPDGNGHIAFCDHSNGLNLWKNGPLVSRTRNSIPQNAIFDVAVTPDALYGIPSGPDAGCSGPRGFYAQNRKTQQWRQLGEVLNETPESNKCNNFTSLTYDAGRKRLWLNMHQDGIGMLRDDDKVYMYNTHNTDGVFTGDMIAGLTYYLMKGNGIDSRGNVWFLNFGSITPTVKPMVQLTPEGKWYSYASALGAGNTFMGLGIDGNGYIWASSREYGILVFDNGGTPTVTTDDRYRLLQDRPGMGNLANNVVTSFQADLNNNMWVGTSTGITVFYNTGGIFQQGVDGSCPVFEQRCLLKEERINCITVDAANRKWVGTNSGLYVLEADGTRQTAYYNAANSPLFSDEVYNVRFDAETGEAFVCTSYGLISLMGTATQGKKNCEELTVFPNPVHPDHQGPVAVRGSATNVTAKITNAQGGVVCELKANGGQTLWDGKDFNGQRVPPGIYFVLLADEQGNSSCIAQIAMLDR